VEKDWGGRSTTKMMWTRGKRAREGKRDQREGKNVDKGVYPFFCRSLLHLLVCLALLPNGGATQILLVMATPIDVFL